MLPFRSLAEIGRVAGYAGPPNRAAAEVVTKYIITDMYAKAVQGMPAESAVKWAHGELVKIGRTPNPLGYTVGTGIARSRWGGFGRLEEAAFRDVSAVRTTRQYTARPNVSIAGLKQRFAESRVDLITYGRTSIAVGTPRTKGDCNRTS